MKNIHFLKEQNIMFLKIIILESIRIVALSIKNILE